MAGSRGEGEHDRKGTLVATSLIELTSLEDHVKGQHRAWPWEVALVLLLHLDHRLPPPPTHT